ncbi:hypothetical protein AB0K52_15570 [Glycomyces sp. NPDC049804]|uniref:hypothetical protein n=1 Tax=Glycomyces sp. NPDC049804 TaxID=3154363 RepID=UPI0034242FC1
MVRGISTATVRRAAAVAIAGAAATALSACGASLGSQTEVKQSAIAGVNIDDGDIALRDLQVEFTSAEGYAAGDDAALRLWIGNEGETEISLESIETTAGTVTFVDPAAQAAEAMEAAREGASESPESDETTGESTEETSAPADGATSEAPAVDELDGEEAYEPIVIAPADYVRLDQGAESGSYFLIENLSEELRPGDTLDVVFHFADGTEVPASLPVGQALAPEEREYYEPEGEAEGH